jgi:hypothetical protein
VHPILGFLSTPIVVAVAIVMVARRLYKEFPFFFIYLIVVVIGDVVREFFTYRYIHGYPYIQYFYAYWITEAADVLVAFLVLYEVFLLRLFPGINLTPIYRYLLPISGAVVAGLTLLMFVSAPSGGPSRLAVLVGEFTLALSFCQVAVLAFFCGLMLFMSREWRRHELGIAAGFGIYGAVKLIITVQRAQQHYGSLPQLPIAAYAFATLIWLFYLSKSDPEPEETEITEEMVQQVERVYGQVLEMFRKRRWWQG